MKPIKNIEKLIKNADLDIDTNKKKDGKILGELFEAQERSKKTRSAIAELSIWGTSVKRLITKLAAAAVIIFVVIIAMNGFAESSGI